MRKMIFMILFLLGSCGEQSGIRNRSTIQQEQIADFSTQLDTTLKVSGTQCEGGERVITNGVEYNCMRDDWLISINNGTPFIAFLQPQNDQPTSTEFSFYVIRASSPISAEAQRTLDLLGVRLTDNGGYSVYYL
jgi:hypothetical protein